MGQKGGSVGLARLNLIVSGADADSAANICDADAETVTTRDLRAAGVRAFLLSRLLRYENIAVIAPRRFARPFLVLLIARLMAKARVCLHSSDGGTQNVGICSIAYRFAKMLGDVWTGRRLLAGLMLEARSTSISPSPVHNCEPDLLNRGRVVVVSSGMHDTSTFGGAVAHMTGVLNALSHHGGDVWYHSARHLQGVSDSIRHVDLEVTNRFWDLPEVPWIVQTDLTEQSLFDVHGDGERVAFVYERHSVFSRAGRRFAAACNVPFVLEYNGSEVWIANNWGGGLKHVALANAMETANLCAAHLVVAVSEELCDDALARGADPSRVVVIPNGVDPAIFDPEMLDPRRNAFRKEMNLSPDDVLVGFSGSFGPWHGAETLARSFLAEWREGRMENGVLMMIGDGPALGETREIMSKMPVARCRIKGQVSALDVPKYLNACDVLVAPQLPDPVSGSFFGSPIKLFEYMAAGRAIVASRIGQPGRVLKDGDDALLFEPGNEVALGECLARLVTDQCLRDRLGANARRKVQACYKWDRHVARLLQEMSSRIQGP